MPSIFRPFAIFQPFRAALSKAAAAILDTADFYAPLTTSLVPEKGTGQATFTRGTTATVEVNNGANGLIQRTALIGEARFPGARRIYNMLQNTTTLATQSVTVVSGYTYTLSFWGTGSIALSGAYTGTLAGTGTSNRVQTTFTAISSTLTLTVTGSVTSAQLENVTGQTTQTAGEYVSNGVLSYPYHGAGVDGVKYLSTKLDGSAIADSTLKGVLVEESRTNLLTYSQEFDNATWVKNSQPGTSVVANAAIAPDGTMSADKIIYDGSGTAGGTRLYKSIGTSSSGVSYISAFYIRSDVPVSIALGQNIGTNNTINVTTEWQRFSTNVAIGNGTTLIIPRILSAPGNNSPFTIYVWSAQCEAATFPSSNIPTTSATVTRNADVLTYSYSHPAGQPGSFLCDLTVPYTVQSGTNPGVQMDDGSNMNLIGFQLSPTNGVNQYSEVSDSAQVQSALSAFVVGTKMKLAQSFQTNRFIAAKDGVLSTVDTSASVPAITRINLSSNNGQSFNGYVGNVRAFKSRMLTDKQLEDATR